MKPRGNLRQKPRAYDMILSRLVNKLEKNAELLGIEDSSDEDDLDLDLVDTGVTSGSSAAGSTRASDVSRSRNYRA